jgi:D-alanyl-lipoteichoic acid acyltransferase DltB (MBOAT superfamily)
MQLGPWDFAFFYSLPFWGAVVLAAMAYRLAGARARARDWVLLAASNLMLLALPRFGPGQLATVWALGLGSYAVARALSGPRAVRGPARRRGVVVLGVVGTLAFLAFFKYRWVQEVVAGGHGTAPTAPADLLTLLGVSYISFKVISVLVDSYNESVTDLDPLTYLNYVLFFPAFISGPINRYGQFSSQVRSSGQGRLGSDLRLGAERIVHGLFKKLVLVQLVYPYILTNQPLSPEASSFLGFVGSLYAYALYAYLDFSAYTDLAIGAARLMGIELPENFDWPFRQKNIREFWSHWHMSLTNWLVDYVYWPLVRKLRNVPYFRSRPVTLSIVGMNVTFVACGMWHGEAFHYVLWGAYQGIGISIAQIYQRQKKRLRSPRLQRYFASKYSHAAGAVLTANYFAFGGALFVLDLGQLRTVLSAFFR